MKTRQIGIFVLSVILVGLFLVLADLERQVGAEAAGEKRPVSAPVTDSFGYSEYALTGPNTPILIYPVEGNALGSRGRVVVTTNMLITNRLNKIQKVMFGASLSDNPNGAVNWFLSSTALRPSDSIFVKWDLTFANKNNSKRQLVMSTIYLDPQKVKKEQFVQTNGSSTSIAYGSNQNTENPFYVTLFVVGLQTPANKIGLEILVSGIDFSVVHEGD